ncbi:hypothetical protein CKA32_006599 [Geitlerinema sp. FC II]|nr:DUF1802 family protein [Geitlerinema sp. CS-897]PPT10386.1 hypothetical protein CKA32_006599 [Geitlerinema sp. FC II]
MAVFALKEWSVAVDALLRGETVALLRKGGIREKEKSFQVKCDRAFLYPTYEHQKPELLKPEYAATVTPVESGWRPKTVAIAGRAEITHRFLVESWETAETVADEFVWNRQFVRDRLVWKPEKPLFLLLLRVYRLREPREIPVLPQYGGCRSWIELAADLTFDDGDAVFDEVAYGDRVREITRRFPTQPV